MMGVEVYTLVNLAACHIIVRATIAAAVLTICSLLVYVSRGADQDGDQAVLGMEQGQDGEGLGSNGIQSSHPRPDIYLVAVLLNTSKRAGLDLSRHIGDHGAAEEANKGVHYLLLPPSLAPASPQGAGDAA